jgi:enamine deaminase RidA (YjgF/YER057c/UK114 family)
MKNKPHILRIGSHTRWSDVVIYNQTARWVEVAEDTSRNAASQVGQILAQIDATLASLGCDRTALLEVVIHLADLSDIAEVNARWDAWVVPGHAPVRACVQSGLSAGCRAEFIIHAAVPGGAPS